MSAHPENLNGHLDIDAVTRILATALVAVQKDLAASARKREQDAAEFILFRIHDVAKAMKTEAAARYNVYDISGRDRGKPRVHLDAERRRKILAADMLRDACGKAVDHCFPATWKTGG